MPNVTGITLKDARKILKELKLDIQGELADDSIITKQVPGEGIQINAGSKVLLYAE